MHRRPSGKLFPRKDGNPVAKEGDHTYSKVLRSATERAGVTPVTMHGLRHSFLTDLAKRLPIQTVQLWARHSEVTTTMLYVHSDMSLNQRLDEIDQVSIDPAADNVTALKKVGE